MVMWYQHGEGRLRSDQGSSSQQPPFAMKKWKYFTKLNTQITRINAIIIRKKNNTDVDKPKKKNKKKTNKQRKKEFTNYYN